MPLNDDKLALLTRSWSHAHEDDKPNLTVFRSSEHAFPRSRGRLSFELKPGGQLVMNSPGPDDRPLAQQGTWRMEADTLHLSFSGDKTQSYKILELKPGYLAVEKLTP